MVREAIFAHNP